jgi:hypothetical protein
MCFILVNTGLMGLERSTTEGRKGEALSVIISLPSKILLSLASIWKQIGSQPLREYYFSWTERKNANPKDSQSQHI